MIQPFEVRNALARFQAEAAQLMETANEVVRIGGQGTIHSLGAQVHIEAAQRALGLHVNMVAPDPRPSVEDAAEIDAGG